MGAQEFSPADNSSCCSIALTRHTRGRALAMHFEIAAVIFKVSAAAAKLKALELAVKAKQQNLLEVRERKHNLRILLSKSNSKGSNGSRILANRHSNFNVSVGLPAFTAATRL